MDLRSSIATQQYAATRPVTAAKPAPGGQNGISEAVGNFADLLRSGEDTAKAALTGGADPHALVQALAQTELAVETAVTVRNKVVEAYQEILRMPV
ncbi:MAG: flagellar hook-basal body complex protein FliE [Marinosulfonomonas sp.]|nr:flagellar hook-basal body complex protein FliE [Marinosulfonomonas sp.]